ncbi:MAG: SpoIIE family protein phosphatase [Desulfobacterales bacterium]
MNRYKHTKRQDLIKEIVALQQELDQVKRYAAGLEQKSQNFKHSSLIIDKSPVILFRRLAAEKLKQRKMVYVSENISRFGYSANDFMNNRIMFRDIVHHDDTERTRREIQDYVSKNIESYKQIYRIVTRDGEARWIEDHTSVVIDPETGIKYHQGIVEDIHQRKEAEDKLRRSEEKYRRIIETTGEGFLLMDSNLTIVDINNAYCRLTGVSRKDLIGRNFIDMVSEKHRFYISANRDDLFKRHNYEFESELMSGSGTSVQVFIHGNTLYGDTGTIIGNMAFVTDMTEHKNALRLAGEVQKSLLPQKAPLIPGIEIFGKTISCDEIGGDYYDFIMRSETPKSQLSVVVGDISGHGVDSALLMTTARAFLRMRASQPGSITEIVSDMNRHLSEDVIDTGKFMTLFYLTVDANRKSIEWVRAGHEPAWLYDPNENRFEELKGPGLALGVVEDYEYSSNRRSNLKKGQMIIVGTDGIWEGHNKVGEMFGKQRVQVLTRAYASSGAENIVNAIFNEHHLFTQDAKSEDDLTMVIIKIT